MNKGKTSSEKSLEEDSRLIKSFMKNNIKSFDKIVLKYQDMVFNLCFQIVRDYDDAGDCAQETFIKVYKNIDKFRFESNFSTWLYRIAVNTCKNRVTSTKFKLNKKMLRIGNTGINGETQSKIEIHDYSYSPEKLLRRIKKSRQFMKLLVNCLKSLKFL